MSVYVTPSTWENNLWCLLLHITVSKIAFYTQCVLKIRLPDTFLKLKYYPQDKNSQQSEYRGSIPQQSKDNILQAHS